MVTTLIKKLHRDRDEILRFCSNFDRIYLYGAGKVARLVLKYLKDENIEVAGCLVTQKQLGYDCFEGLPIEEVSRHKFEKNQGIILGVGKKFRQEILADLGEKIPRTQIYVQLIYNTYDSIRNESERGQSNGGGKGFFEECWELEAIGSQCGTDKAESGHNYLRKYEYMLKPFKDKEFNFLELGIYNGASLELWSRYFSKASIVGVDIDGECQRFASGRKQVLIMDLSLEENLQKLKKFKPAVIVDDASHLWSHQIMALFTLFDALPSGGVYILEDLGTSFPSYRYENYNDSVVSAYEICSAIAEAVTGGEGLDITRISATIALFKWEIETLAKKIEMIAMIEESWIFIKK